MITNSARNQAFPSIIVHLGRSASPPLERSRTRRPEAWLPLAGELGDWRYTGGFATSRQRAPRDRPADHAVGGGAADEAKRLPVELAAVDADLDDDRFATPSA